MVNHAFGRLPIESCLSRIKLGKGRLAIDVPAHSFREAFSTFSQDAERFATTLSDGLNRKFAFRYLAYLQEIAQGAEAKPNGSGRPDFRLICNELERLFRFHFFKPDKAIAV